MNKHELKFLLENIYTALTEADIPDHPPAPANWDTISPDPWPWPPNTIRPTPPPAPTPPPPKPRLPSLVKPENGDNPDLLDEINRLLDMLRQLQNLPPDVQDTALGMIGYGNLAGLRARIQQLLDILIQQRNQRRPIVASNE